MPKPYYKASKNKLEEIIRVNHAGEFGAQKIYEGQLAFTKSKEDKKIIKHMLEQELEHLEYFEQQIKRRKMRPTILAPIWNVFGYYIGAISALMGTKTAMLVTESVEHVIVDHYQEQINLLEKFDEEQELLAKIKKFKQDEAEHIHIAIENDSKFAPINKITSCIVANICKYAIFLSKKI